MKTAGHVVGVTSALLSGWAFWGLLAGVGDQGIHPLTFLQLAMPPLGLWATLHGPSRDFLPVIAALALVGGFGWYFLLVPFPVRWIGVGNLGYLVAWRLLRDPSEVVRNEARPL